MTIRNVSPNAAANKIYADARRMLRVEHKSSQQVREELEGRGVSPETAAMVVEELNAKEMQEVVALSKGKAKRDMLFGAMWCIGGVIGTFAETGFVFWGAMAFGALQFLRGLVNFLSK